MKRIAILVLLLVGCQNEAVEVLENQAPIVEVVEHVEEEIFEEEEIILDEELIKSYVMKANEKTRIVDLEELHERISEELIRKVDFELPIDDQKDLIEEIVSYHMNEWKNEIVELVIDEEGGYLDYETILAIEEKTSVRQAYELMLSYETIFLKNYK
jgi:hypothetical protein